MCAVQANAQQTGAGPATGTAQNPKTAAATTLGELIVTAQKREERLQTVPVAISAYSAEQRSLVGIETVQDLTNFTPGFHYNSITNRPYMRGVGRNTDNLSVASAVATYYNGVYHGANANTLLQHSDLFIDTVEVDRGPQNTLHGANADGGSINYISKRPTKSFYAEGRAGVQNYDAWFTEAVVSGPINDNLRFRLGGNYTDQSGGFFNNLIGPAQGGVLPQASSGHSQYWEAQLEGNFGEHLEGWFMASSGTFSADYHTVASQGAIPNNYYQIGTFSPSGFYGLCGLPGVASSPGGNIGCNTGPAVISVTPARVTANLFPGNNPSTADPHTFIQENTSTNKQRADISLQTNWTYHLPFADLTYLGGYEKFNYVLNFTPATGAGVLAYQLAGPTSPAAAGLCFLDAAGAKYNPAGCLQPLNIFPSPNTTFFQEKDAFFSHEIDLTSTTNGPLQWIGGFYYYRERYEQPVWANVVPAQTQFQTPFYLTLPGGIPFLTPAPVNTSSAASTSDTFLTYVSYAVFGQASYKFTDQWKLTLGLRYNDDHKYGDQYWRFVAMGGDPLLGLNVFGPGTYGANTPALDLTQVAVGKSLTTSFPGAGVVTINPADGFAHRKLDQTWVAWTGDVILDWTPDPDTLVYGKYSRGYKSGGFSTFSISSAVGPQTGAEKVDAFEIGLKKTFARQFQLNAAAFYYDYKDDQIPLNLQDPTTGQINLQLFNLKTVHITGVELEGQWQPIDNLQLSLQYSYLDTNVNDAGGCFEDTNDPLAQQPGANTSGCTQTSATAIVQNLKGQQLPEAPPNKVSFNALYTFNFEPGKLTLAATFIWKDKTYGSIFNRPYSAAPSYDQTNFRATWSDQAGRYNVIAFVNNAFDNLGYDGRTGTLVAPGFLLSNLFLIAPRTYGIQFQYRFK